MRVNFPAMGKASAIVFILFLVLSAEGRNYTYSKTLEITEEQFNMLMEYCTGRIFTNPWGNPCDCREGNVNPGGKRTAPLKQRESAVIDVTITGIEGSVAYGYYIYWKVDPDNRDSAVPEQVWIEIKKFTMRDVKIGSTVSIPLQYSYFSIWKEENKEFWHIDGIYMLHPLDQYSLQLLFWMNPLRVHRTVKDSNGERIEFTDYVPGMEIDMSTGREPGR